MALSHSGNPPNTWIECTSHANAGTFAARPVDRPRPIDSRVDVLVANAKTIGAKASQPSGQSAKFTKLIASAKPPTMPSAARPIRDGASEASAKGTKLRRGVSEELRQSRSHAGEGPRAALLDAGHRLPAA